MGADGGVPGHPSAAELSDVRSRLLVGALSAWAACTAIVALFGHHHWAVAPATWLVVPAVLCARFGASASWGVTWPTPAGRSAIELALAAMVVVGVAALVAGRASAPALATGVLVLHVCWIVPAEELFFRGMLQGAARSRLGPASAAAMSAVGFGVSHAVIWRDPVGLLTAIPAIVFAMAREWQRSLVGPMLLHATANVSLMAWATAFR